MPPKAIAETLSQLKKVYMKKQHFLIIFIIFISSFGIYSGLKSLIKSGKEKPGKNVTDLKWVKPQEVEKYLGVNLPSRLHEYLTNLA